MLNLFTVSHVASRLILKCQTKKTECHVSFFSYELVLCVVGPDLENRCRLNKAIKRRMQVSEQKKSQQLSWIVRKSMQNLCSPSSRCTASLPSLPYVFIYPVMWVPVHGQPRNFSGTSGSNGERVLSTEAEGAEAATRRGLLSVKCGRSLTTGVPAVHLLTDVTE